MSSFVRLDPPRETGADHATVREALACHARFEHMRALRIALVHLLALGGLLLWSATGWPQWWSQGAVTHLLAAWGIGFVAVVVVGGLEYKWYRRRARFVSPGTGQGEHRA